MRAIITIIDGLLPLLLAGACCPLEMSEHVKTG